MKTNGGFKKAEAWLFAFALGEDAGPTRGSLLLVALGFLPVCLQFFVNLWERPHYQFFPLAVVGVFLLGGRVLKSSPHLRAGGNTVAGGVFLGGAMGLLAAATLLWSPWLGMLAALLCWVGVCWRASGVRLVGAMLPSLVLALTFLPPPLKLDLELMQSLQATAVRWSSLVLDALGVVHLVSGSTLELPNQKLLVEEACSGINSFLLTLAVGLFYLLWQRRSVWRILLCLPCVLASVVLGNVGRITLGAWLQYRGSINILSGWRHELVGLILMGSYVGLIWSLDAFLCFLLERVPDHSGMSVRQASAAESVPVSAADSLSPASASGGQRKPSRGWWLLGGVFALLGVAGVGQGWKHHSQQIPEPAVAARASALRAGATFSLPEKIGEWTRQQSEVPLLHKVETMGIYSQIWNYRNGELAATVALDYPFRGYHDVTECYVNNGWKIVKKERKDGRTDASPAWMEVEMKQEPLSWGALWFSTVDEQGRWMEVLVAKSEGRWQERFQELPVGDETTSYRIQTLVTDFTPLSAAQRESTGQLFEATRKLLAQQLLGQLQPTPPTQP